MNRKSKKDIEKFFESPTIAVPLAIRQRNGKYVEKHGTLGVNGFSYESKELLLIGQVIDAKVVLLGLGVEIQVQAEVVSVHSAADYICISARFEDIAFETERLIARWLDLLVSAHQTPAAA